MIPRQAEKAICATVGAITDPIVAYPGGWSIPAWLKEAIITERLVMNMKHEEPTGTDAEACAYLMTASLCFPLSSDWANIYFYVAGRTYRFHHNDRDVPEDIRVESLSDYEMGELRRLKRDIYNSRTRAREERERTERREKREEAAAQRKAEKPELALLFNFEERRATECP